MDVQTQPSVPAFDVPHGQATILGTWTSFWTFTATFT